MPTTYTHLYFGEKLLKAYPVSLQEQLAPHLDLFRFGLHGPDVLFYYGALSSNPVNRIGYAMHGQPARAFFERGAALVRSAKGAARQQALAYLLGFSAHLALDSICHGYIEKKEQVSGLSHAQIEMEYDRYLLTQQGIDPIRVHLSRYLRPSRSAAGVMAPFFEGVSARLMLRTQRDMVLYLELLRAPGRAKRGLIAWAMRVTGNEKAMSGMVMSLVPEPRCVDSNLRLDKLLQKALPLAVRLCDELLEQIGQGTPLGPWFDRTFSAGDGWQDIPVFSPEEEQRYEVETDVP